MVFRIYNLQCNRPQKSQQHCSRCRSRVCTLQSNQRWCRIMKCQWVSNSNVFFLLQQFSVVFVDMCCSLLGPNAPPHLYDVEVGLHATERLSFLIRGKTWQGLLVSPALRCWSCWRPYSLKLPLPGHQCGEVCCRRIDFWVNKQHIFWWTSFCEFLLGWLNNMHFCLVLKNFRSSQIKTKSVSLCNHVWCQHLRAPAWWGWKVACNMFCRSWGQKSCRTMP